MSESVAVSYTNFVLPPSVVSHADVAHLVRDAETVDGTLTTVSVRAKSGVTDQPQVTLSKRLADFLALNNIELLKINRGELIHQLRTLKETAPVVHMTFAQEADQESLEQLTGWFRSSVHRHAVVEVGLQPSLVAGVYLRTPNHVHDMSLRALLGKGHGLIVDDLEALRGGR